MPPWVATSLCCIGIAAFNLVGRDRDSRTSAGLWFAVLWIVVGATRPVSLWLGAGMAPTGADTYLEGSPIDRAVSLALLTSGVVVLIKRNQRATAFFRSNPAILLFLCYCGLSSIWSDYPFVAFKRWTRSLGNVVAVAIILTESDPLAALQRLLARVGYLLVPLSVLVIKYYGDIGRAYDSWTGAVVYTGLSGDKNALGSVCLVCGLGAMWNIAGEILNGNRKSKELMTHVAVLVMVVWLFGLANSATSLACFVLGAGILVALTFLPNDRSWTVHAVVGVAATAAAIAIASSETFTYVVGSLGRDTTLTGRRELWGQLLLLDKAPWFGSGFDSFFLGPRLKYLWDQYWWHPVEAHNGYLEIYLNLGLVGLALLAVVFLTGYGHIVATFRRQRLLGTLQAVLLCISAAYNYTEAAFKVMNPMLIAFLIAVAAVPEFNGDSSRASSRIGFRRKGLPGRARPIWVGRSGGVGSGAGCRTLSERSVVSAAGAGPVDKPAGPKRHRWKSH